MLVRIAKPRGTLKSGDTVAGFGICPNVVRASVRLERPVQGRNRDADLEANANAEGYLRHLSALARRGGTADRPAILARARVKASRSCRATERLQRGREIAWHLGAHSLQLAKRQIRASTADRIQDLHHRLAETAQQWCVTARHSAMSHLVTPARCDIPKLRDTFKQREYADAR